MTKCIKFKGYIKLHRTTIKDEKDLNDAEVRLFYIYIMIVDWDEKHRDVFGSSNITIRGIKECYLPSWAIGKISYTRSSLIKKGYLEKQSKRIYVINYCIYRNNVQRAEQKNQSTEQIFQSPEHNVQQNEQNTNNEVLIPSLENGLFPDENKNIIQQNEQSRHPKENLKKFKKELKKVDNDFIKKSNKNKRINYIENIRPKLIRNRNLNTKDFPFPV